VPLLYEVLGHGGKFDWRAPATMVGIILAVGGLLVRSQYKGSSVARIVATAGAVMILAVYLIPKGGSVPLVSQLKAIGHAAGKAKPEAFVNVLPFFLAVLTLLVWLPPPSTAGATGIAWTWIVLPVLTALTGIIAAKAIGASLKGNLAGVFWLPIAHTAWLALAGYGLATCLGKQNQA